MLPGQRDDLCDHCQCLLESIVLDGNEVPRALWQTARAGAGLTAAAVSLTAPSSKGGASGPRVPGDPTLTLRVLRATYAGKACGDAPINSTYHDASAVNDAWPLAVTIDNTTHGSWISGGYGRDGYVLFAFDDGPNGTVTDRVSLPPYISSVSLPPLSTEMVRSSGTGWRRGDEGWLMICRARAARSTDDVMYTFVPGLAGCGTVS